MDYLWWKQFKKAKEFLASTQESEPFVVFKGEHMVVMGDSGVAMFWGTKLLATVQKSFVDLVATRPHYQPVLDAFEVLMKQIRTCNDEVDKVHKVDEIKEVSGASA